MHSSTNIRKATIDDLSLLAELARVTFVDAFGQDMEKTALQQHLEENMSDAKFLDMMNEDVFLVAHESEHLVGFVQIGSANLDYAQHLEFFENTASEIKRLYVLAANQQSGLGSALLTLGMQDIVGEKSVYVTTWESNLGAQKLYRSFGFSKVGQFPEYGRSGELNGYEYIMFKPA